MDDVAQGERPRVTIKFAASVDGRVATVDGDSKWISGAEARQEAHRLRARHDAILVGIGTVLADDPELTVRHVEGRNPIRIVADSGLRTPLSARVLQTDRAQTYIACLESAEGERREALLAQGASLIVVSDADGRIDLEDFLTTLSTMGIESLFVEGGPTLITSFLRQRLADRVAAFVAPTVIGEGRNAIGDLGVRLVGEAPRVVDPVWRVLGRDALLEGQLSWGE